MPCSARLLAELLGAATGDEVNCPGSRGDVIIREDRVVGRQGWYSPDVREPAVRAVQNPSRPGMISPENRKELEQ